MGSFSELGWRKALAAMPAGWRALLVAIPGSKAKGAIRRLLLVGPSRHEKSCPFRGFLMA